MKWQICHGLLCFQVSGARFMVYNGHRLMNEPNLPFGATREAPLRFMTLLLAILCSFSAFSQTYRVGPGDLLKISVIELKEMDSDYRVDNRGNLNLPYIGVLSVQNATVIELQQKITEKLQDGFVNNPQVFIDILEYNFRPITVIGAVNKPGKLKRVEQNVTLIDAISQSGGVLENASDKIFVIRKTEEGLNETLEISYNQLMIEGLWYLNVPLFPGDTVNIPMEKPMVVSVIGEVNKPGQLLFSRDSKVTILRLIAAAGGFTDYAKRHKILVKREVNGQPTEIAINVKNIEKNKAADFVMQHNDVVIVP